MDPSCLPRQVINSQQATANGRCSKNIASTRRAYKMAFEEVHRSARKRKVWRNKDKSVDQLLEKY
jgi:hypothetical protein